MELPDGKVISGSESGQLLLWEGRNIKAQIIKKNSTFCHEGAIEVLLLEGTTLISGGHDGYVAWHTLY